MSDGRNSKSWESIARESLVLPHSHKQTKEVYQHPQELLGSAGFSFLLPESGVSQTGSKIIGLALCVTAFRSPACRANSPHESTISCCLRPHRVRQVESSSIPLTCNTHLCQTSCSGSPCVDVPKVLPQLVWVTHAMSSK